jgi:hypothetical protein
MFHAGNLKKSHQTKRFWEGAHDDGEQRTAFRPTGRVDLRLGPGFEPDCAGNGHDHWQVIMPTWIQLAGIAAARDAVAMP